MKTVFSRPHYALLAAGVSIALFLFVTWLPNRELLLFAVVSGAVSFWGLLGQSFGFFLANQTPSRVAVSLAVIVLSGINIAMLWYHLAQRLVLSSGAGMGIAGILVGLLGMGCAACGSVILSSVFGLSAAGAFLGFLPFGGIEFGIFGLLALTFSIRVLGQRIERSPECAT